MWHTAEDGIVMDISSCFPFLSGDMLARYKYNIIYVIVSLGECFPKAEFRRLFWQGHVLEAMVEAPYRKLSSSS